MNQRGILSHVQNVFFIPQKQFVEYTYEQSWNVDSYMFPPSLSNSYIEHMKKNCILSHFCNLQTLDPTK